MCSQWFFPFGTHIFAVSFECVCELRESYFRVDEKCGRKHITISQNQLKVCVCLCMVCSKCIDYILTELRASVRFAEHVIDAERYCRWCITYARTWFPSRTGIGVRYFSVRLYKHQTHMPYITSTLLFLLLILDFVRFCISHFTADGWRSALRKIAKCIYFYYITEENRIKEYSQWTHFLSMIPLWI